MKKGIIVPAMLLIGSIGLLNGCGNNSTANLPSTEKQVEQTTEATEFYTVKFDKNTTPEDLTDDESFSYFTTGWNSQKKSSTVEIPKTEDAFIPAEDVPLPTRKGYFFAGWQTKPVVEETDLIHGVSKYQVFFGQKISEVAQLQLSLMDKDEIATRDIYQEASYIKDMEELSEDGTLTLYARWVEQKEIATEEDLKNIANDLYGAYLLTDDIILTGEWEPIGAYYSNYEFYNNNWWTYAFRGSLNGNGHTISGLSITNATSKTPDWIEDEAAIWHADGSDGNGSAALFAAISHAQITNLIIDQPRITIQGANKYQGHFLYAGSVASFDMESTILGVTVSNPTILVECSDEDVQYEEHMYIAIGGIEGGGWSSTVKNCVVNNGKIEVNANTVTRHGGEIYVGGAIGEGFATVGDNAIEAVIRVNGKDESNASKDTNMVVRVGGLSASSTNTTNNTVTSTLDIAVDKQEGQSEINVGGIAGAQRYQMATGNLVASNITTDCKLDDKNSTLNVGAAVGSFDVYYAVITLQYSEYLESGTSGNTINVNWNGQPYNTLMPETGYPHLNGEKITHMAVNDIEKDGISYNGNIDQLIDVYGGYIPTNDMIKNGLMIIKIE